MRGKQSRKPFGGVFRSVANGGNDTRAIWDRQVGNFWEVSWVIARSPVAGDPDPLSLRKNWRTTSATVEPGDHCTMMGSWQELSGHIRSQTQSSKIHSGRRFARVWGDST